MKGLREGLSSGAEPLSIKDLQSIKFTSLPAGKLEGGKLTQEQFKAFYLPAVAMLDDITGLEKYAATMLQLMEKPDIELAGHYLLLHPTARTLQIDKHLGAELPKQSHQP